MLWRHSTSLLLALTACTVACTANNYFDAGEGEPDPEQTENQAQDAGKTKQAPTGTDAGNSTDGATKDAPGKDSGVQEGGTGYIPTIGGIRCGTSICTFGSSTPVCCAAGSTEGSSESCVSAFAGCSYGGSFPYSIVTRCDDHFDCTNGERCRVQVGLGQYSAILCSSDIKLPELCHSNFDCSPGKTCKLDAKSYSGTCG